MGYYTRIFSPSKRILSVDELQAILEKQSLAASFSIQAGTANEWSTLVLSHQTGPEIAILERNLVNPDSLGAAEIEEFLEEIAECKPASASEWLANYLPKVKTIIAFQWLNGTEVKNGRDILGSVMIEIHKILGGVIQSDGEGFSDDEQGDSILWQFSDGVKGPWRMAVLRNGKWVRFEMQLGNRKHREAFFRGEVPSGAKLLN